MTDEPRVIGYARPPWAAAWAITTSNVGPQTDYYMCPGCDNYVYDESQLRFDHYEQGCFDWPVYATTPNHTPAPPAEPDTADRRTA